MSYYHATIHSTTALNPDTRKGEVIAYIDGAQDPRDVVAWVEEYMRRNVRDGETRPPVTYWYGDTVDQSAEVDITEHVDAVGPMDDYTPSPHLFDNLAAGGVFRG